VTLYRILSIDGGGFRGLGFTEIGGKGLGEIRQIEDLSKKLAESVEL
jgi:hypothetical protein